MAGSPLQGFKRYLATLLSVVVFPVLWLRSLRFARASDDPRGVGKVAVAIVASVLIVAGGAWALKTYHDGAKEGMVEALDGRLAEAVGESEYQATLDNIDGIMNGMNVGVKRLNDTVAASANTTDADKAQARSLHEQATAAMAAIQGDGGLIDAARETEDVGAAGNEFRARFQSLAAIKAGLQDLALKAQPPTGNATVDADNPAVSFGHTFDLGVVYAGENVTDMQSLAGQHLLYLDLQPHLGAHDDAAAKDVIASSTVQQEEMHERAARAFAIKDDAYADMMQVYWWFLIPCLVAAFYAPIVFALGSILRVGYEQSETVGFKPYPSRSMGWFLLLGGFGVPGLFFAAWAVKDIQDRDAEGQIAL